MRVSINLTATILCLLTSLGPGCALAVDTDRMSKALNLVRSVGSARPYAAIVDLAERSSSPRFHVVRRSDGQVVLSTRVAHGLGSDRDHDGYAEVFSNTKDSGATSVGLYMTLGRYVGEYGQSMRLKGLSPTNSKALEREVVLHSASYAEPAAAEGNGGVLGRSCGCFVLSSLDRERVMRLLTPGSIIYAFGPEGVPEDAAGLPRLEECS